jgi:Uma2 family endonuclease
MTAMPKPEPEPQFEPEPAASGEPARTPAPDTSLEPAESLRLLTIAEYAELGETEHGYTELVEGRLLMSPSPSPAHNIVIAELYIALRAVAPKHLRVVPDVDVDLELAAEDEPGHSRRPDLVVVDQDAVNRVDVKGGILKASDVALVVEIVSPGSRRTDHVNKRRDYADAGIPHYWIVDIDEPVAITACHLTEEFGYVDDQVTTGKFHTESPFPVTLDLDQLR